MCSDQISRRNFIKLGGLTGSALSIGGIAGAGYAMGKDPRSNTGWENNFSGGGQFFDRTRYRVDHPTYEVVGKTRRCNLTLEDVVDRGVTMKNLAEPPDGSPPKWLPDMGVDKMPEPLRTFFKENPIEYKEMVEIFLRMQKQTRDWPKFADELAIPEAWDKAHSDSFGGIGREDVGFPNEPVHEPPEIHDFKGIHREKPLEFKSPAHASELIKKVAHSFGATLVGATKLNPDWVYTGRFRGVPGYHENFEIPSHWKNVIVFAVPHKWDVFYANPAYGTSMDAYASLRQIGGKLECFLRELGYAARANVPPESYDLIMPPVAIDAGLGEQSRISTLITPELGSNARLGAVITNLDIKPDKPIDIGVTHFCKKCKICADQCPSGSISTADEPTEVIRGYKRWHADATSCLKFWCSTPRSHASGCRVCIAVCPYSRKNNWVHTVSREVDPMDPTGLFASGLLWMQKKFFKYPKAQDYYSKPDGKNASYHAAPDWMQSKKWFKI